jgi:hypothetical protein
MFRWDVPVPKCVLLATYDTTDHDSGPA